MKVGLLTGESVKNIRLTRLGAICADTICETFQIHGKRIFGHLSKMFRKNPHPRKPLGQIHRNLGAKTIFIGKKKDFVLKMKRNICGSGIKKPDLQTLSITLGKILKRITASLLSGTVRLCPNKTMPALSVNNQKWLLSETRLFLWPLTTVMKQEKQEVYFAPSATVDLAYFGTHLTFSKMQFNTLNPILLRR